jgi:hypothetical protein
MSPPADPITVGSVVSLTTFVVRPPTVAAFALRGALGLVLRAWPQEVSPVRRRLVAQRRGLQAGISRTLDTVVETTVAEVFRRGHLTEAVVRYIDLDRVVAVVDLDAAVRGVDLEGVVGRVDLDRLVAQVDIDAAVARVDVNAIAERLDLPLLLDRLDLTSVVIERVDLDAVVDALLEQIDLAGVVQQVIEAIDLPGIIRQSTGSMATDTVQGVRMQGIAADEAVARVVERMRRRRPKDARVRPDQQPTGSLVGSSPSSPADSRRRAGDP